MGEIASRVAQHLLNVAHAFVIEEGVRDAVNVLHVIAAERLHDIDGFVVLFAEVPRMRLNFNADAFALKNRQQLFHGAIEHLIANLRLVRIAGKLGVDHLYTHFNRDFDQPFPVFHCRLTAQLIRTGPAIDADKRRELHAGIAQRLLVLSHNFPAGPRVLVERVDLRVRRLLNVFVAPFGHLVDHAGNPEVFNNINVKSNFHRRYLCKEVPSAKRD